jgi:homoserine kinase type II|tara:strand:- start:20 stop:988 length:969 start_codon:yes stop_codon:yes gene_type:complete
MAVYTKISKEELNDFLKKYEIGKVKKFLGIKDGIENTNYLIQTEKDKFILTIYEKRVNIKDLPFFIGLMTNLYNSNFRCPRPVINKNGNYISEISGKKAAIVSFLEGSAKKNLSSENCYDIGVETAKLHEITKDLSLRRQNNLSLDSWSELFSKVEKDCSKIHKNLSKTIKKSLKEIKRNWPKKLPSGIIHADLFPDNIFFKNEKFTGIIDFYFSCNDFYSFEIAVCLNALCFDGVKENLSFNVTKARKFIKGYTSIRKLNKDEKEYLKVLAQGASMRFLLTRVFDYLNLSKGALLTVKDPVEYLKRLEFHNSVKSFEDYCI